MTRKELRALEAEGYRIDTIRVGLARRFRLAIVHDPLAECAKRGVTPEAMIELAETTDFYGRDRRQGRLF